MTGGRLRSRNQARQASRSSVTTVGSSRIRLQTPKPLSGGSLEHSNPQQITNITFRLSMPLLLNGSCSNNCFFCHAFSYHHHGTASCSPPELGILSLGTKLIPDGYFGKPALEINNRLLLAATVGVFGVLSNNLLGSERHHKHSDFFATGFSSKNSPQPTTKQFY